MKRKLNDSTNIWDYKPAWCQPWSIILTGLTMIVGSWLILHQVWITTAILIPIVAWWIYFLIVYPQAFARYVKAQQNRVTD